MENGQTSVTNIFKLLTVIFSVDNKEIFSSWNASLNCKAQNKIAKNKKLNSVVMIPLRTQLFLFHDVIYTIVTRKIKFTK